MSDKKILLLGSGGQLGTESKITLKYFGDLTAMDFPEIDFSEPESLRPVIQAVAPDIIVNTAAYTAVDKAESNKEVAAKINAEAPGVIAEEAAKLDVVFVHYSTDYVFNGEKPEPYVEDDDTCPLSVYGSTKRDGEIAAAKAPKHLIFRTSWVVGAHGKNFIRTMLKLAAEHEGLRVVADQFGAPTSAKLLAETTKEVLKAMRGAESSDPRWGLYHLVAGGETSWNGLARRVIGKAADEYGMKLKVKPEGVAKIKTSEYPTPATRPFNSRLNTAKIRESFGVELPDWTVGVDDVLAGIIKEGV